MDTQVKTEAALQRNGVVHSAKVPSTMAPSANTQAEEKEPLSIFAASAPDWRIWFGLSITLLWLIMLSLYVSGTVGWQNIGKAPIETLGNFLEGAFAPLAFLWLVIGYFLQKKELSQNTEAIKMQHVEIQKTAEQAEIQAEAIRATELHTRKESFLQLADMVKQHLGAIMGLLFISSQGSANSQIVTGEKVSELWAKMNKSDPEVFSRSMLEIQFLYGDRYAYKLFYGTPIRTQHTENFIFHFERLINAAADCDDTGMIRDSLAGSAHGFVYARAVASRDMPPDGFTYGIYDFDPDTHND